MLSVFFADLNHRLGLPPFSLFLVALTLTDGMCLAILLKNVHADISIDSNDRDVFLQRDRHRYDLFFILSTSTKSLFVGSWLEIGQTISFFCISSLLLVWSAGICALGESLLRSSQQSLPKEKSG